MRTVAVPDLASPERRAYRIFSVAHSLSTPSFVGHSPVTGKAFAARHDGSPRMPLFPLPPPIVAAASPSFGCDSDCGDCDSDGARSVSRIVGLKRIRSFNSSRSSLLGPSRTSPGLSGGYRPPPIHTAASLDPGSFGANGSFSDATNGASPVVMMLPGASSSSGAGAGVGSAGTTDENDESGVLRPTILVAPSPAESAFYSSTPAAAAARSPLSFGRRNRRVFPRLGGRRSPVPPMSLVAERLYVGDETAASDLDAIVASGITHILNCTQMPNALDGCFTSGPDGAPRPLQFAALGLLDSISDLPRMQGALNAGVAFIRQGIASGGAVLVHCHKGISRSATLAIAYLVATTHTPAEALFEQMRTRRRIIDPNLTYWTQLIEWERKHLPPSVLARQHSSSASSTPRRQVASSLAGGAGEQPPRTPLHR